MQYDISANTDQSLGTLVARGEIDLATVAGLREGITNLLATGLTHLLVDLSAVTFIDSTGLGVLVGAGKRARRVGGSMRLVCSDPRVMRLFTLTGLAVALAVHTSREAAMADWPVPTG